MTIPRVKGALFGCCGVAAMALTALPMAATAATPAASGTIKIGAFAPESGGSASSGIDIINAVKLAVANANKAGGVLGQQLQVDPQDAPCSPQQAAQSAQKLVSDGVAAVVGPYCSGDALASEAIFHRAGIAMVTPASTNPKLTALGYNDVFRTCGIDSQQGTFVAGIMVHKLHAHTIAIIHDNTAYAKGLATYTRDALSKYSGTKVVFFDAITPGSRDFSSTLTSLRTRKPDVTYFTGYYADGGLLLKQFAQLGVPGQFMAGDSNNDVTFIKLAGSAASKALISTLPTPQLIPGAAAFVKQFTATYHTAPGPYSGYAYDATNVVINAIKSAKSASASAIVSALPKTSNYHGVTGSISFTKIGDRSKVQYVILGVNNGAFVPKNM